MPPFMKSQLLVWSNEGGIAVLRVNEGRGGGQSLGFFNALNHTNYNEKSTAGMVRVSRRRGGRL